MDILQIEIINYLQWNVIGLE